MKLSLNVEDKMKLTVTQFKSKNTVKDMKNFIESAVKKPISIFHKDKLLSDDFVLGELCPNSVPLLDIYTKGCLFVKLSSGQKVIFDYLPYQCVDDIRERFYDKTEFPTYKLMFNNIVLEDGYLLSHYGVEEDCFLYLDMGTS